MTNLLRMDLYRMRKAKSFRVCLLLAFLLALASTPLEALLYRLGRLLSSELEAFPETRKLSDIIGSPLPTLNAVLALLSVCSFFYADMENGYIKNIAGQTPIRSFTILSRFLASVPHSLIFLLAGVIGDIVGTLPFQRIAADGAVLDSLRIFALKFLLLESICAILLLFTSGFRNKSLGTVFAVLFGSGLLFLAYLGLDAGLDKLLPKKNFLISDYMPDQLLSSGNPDTVTALIVSAVTIGVFLWLAMRIFDRKDVK